MSRLRRSRVVGALLAVVMVAGGLAVVPRLQPVRDADADDTGVTDLEVDDGRSVPDAAGAVPGDPITLTVIVETVDRSGAPTTTSQAFDVSTIDDSGAVTPLPALDTSTATARPDRSSAGAVAGTITIAGTTHEVTGTTWMDHEYGYFGGSSADARVRWLLLPGGWGCGLGGTEGSAQAVQGIGAGTAG